MYLELTKLKIGLATYTVKVERKQSLAVAIFVNKDKQAHMGTSFRLNEDPQEIINWATKAINDLPNNKALRQTNQL